MDTNTEKAERQHSKTHCEMDLSREMETKENMENTMKVIKTDWLTWIDLGEERPKTRTAKFFCLWLML